MLILLLKHDLRDSMAMNLFLHESRLRFERLMATKEKLDSKANTIIATSGTIATLFMGFGLFLLSDIDPIGLFFIPAMVVLLAEIILTVITLRHAIIAYRLAEYFYPFETVDFLQDDNTIDHNNIRHFLNAPQDILEEEVSNTYWECIRDNEASNNNKVQNIDSSQNYLILSVSLIPLFSFIVILAKYVI